MFTWSVNPMGKYFQTAREERVISYKNACFSTHKNVFNRFKRIYTIHYMHKKLRKKKP